MLIRTALYFPFYSVGILDLFLISRDVGLVVISLFLFFYYNLRAFYNSVSVIVSGCKPVQPLTKRVVKVD